MSATFTKEMKKEYTLLIPNMVQAHFNLVKEVFVNHGEPAAAQTLANRIREAWDVAVIVPQTGERIYV